MKKRLEKLEEQQPKVENEELKRIYDQYVNAKQSGNESACLYFAEKAKPFLNDYQYRAPEFANGIIWRKLVKETWRPPAELERLRKEYSK